jgi:hypothetical protein
MLIELISNHYLEKSTPESQNHPQSIYDYINSKITERNTRIEDEESDDDDIEFMTLKPNEFRIVVWMIDNVKYYDVCNFKDDAEVGDIMSFEYGDGLVKICEVDEDSLTPYDGYKYMKKWCKMFEKKRSELLEQ